jgi:hypothetical protein
MHKGVWHIESPKSHGVREQVDPGRMIGRRWGLPYGVRRVVSSGGEDRHRPAVSEARDSSCNVGCQAHGAAVTKYRTTTSRTSSWTADGCRDAGREF